jgi:hypothetical protein
MGYDWGSVGLKGFGATCTRTGEVWDEIPHTDVGYSIESMPCGVNEGVRNGDVASHYEN